MLRLNLSTEPCWYDFGGGLRLLLRPADVELLGEAESDPAVAALRREIAHLDDPEQAPDEVKRRLGLALTAAVARLAIVGWEGVGNDKGEVIPEPYPEAVDALMRHPVVSLRFSTLYMQPLLLLADEGNDYVPAPNGISAAGPITAAPAPGAAKPARTSKTAP